MAVRRRQLPVDFENDVDIRAGAFPQRGHPVPGAAYHAGQGHVLEPFRDGVDLHRGEPLLRGLFRVGAHFVGAAASHEEVQAYPVPAQTAE